MNPQDPQSKAIKSTAMWLCVFLIVLLTSLAGCIQAGSGDKSQINNIECGDDAVRCVPCVPGEIDCSVASLVQCREDGRGFRLLEECASAQLCVDGLGSETCADPVCAPGEAKCAGSIMQVCAAGRHTFDLIPCDTDDACLRGLERQTCATAECSDINDCAGEDTQCRRRVCVEGLCDVENLSTDTACTIASDCPGEDTACRTRACVNSACGFSDLPEGTTCEAGGVTGICTGDGVCTPTADCTIATDCPGEDTDCRLRTCVDGSCGIENLSADSPCNIAGVNGACDGSGSCLVTDECTIAADCPGNDSACRLRACVQGACGFVDLPAATACETAGVAGECDGQGLCQPTVQCAIASDCPGNDTQCRLRACVAGVCGFADTPEATPCEVGGLSGSCDGAGVCRQTSECTVATDCPGPDNDCRSRECTNGQCGFAFAEVGSVCSINGFGGTCDGAGVCNQMAECNTPLDCPPSVDDCRQPTCLEGRCSTVNLSGTFCQIGESRGTCDDGECECNSACNNNSLLNTHFCNNQCVCVATSVEHCGACGNSCEENEVCSGGQCRCTGIFRECSNSCVNIRTNSEHCTGCNKRCPQNSDCDTDCPGSGINCRCSAGYSVCENRCILRNSQEWIDLECSGNSVCLRTL